MDANMDGIRRYFTEWMSLSFLLLILLQTPTEAQEICEAPQVVHFVENNTVGEVVTTITVQPGVTIEFTPPPANPNNPFRLEENKLIAAEVLDYEIKSSYEVVFICTATSGLTLIRDIAVLVTNINDNPPIFSQDLYDVNVNEMSPVGMSVGRFTATDLDGSQIYYKLTPESNAFRLASATNPSLLVVMPLDYDKVKNVQLTLYAQDTPLASVDGRNSFTASTIIMVTIVDVDNRPPWFQPCAQHDIGDNLICQSSGYTGNVVLNQQQIGSIPLKPGPLYAIDGDNGIKDEITYSFLNGNGAGLFEINPNSGNISMLKPADVLGPISLTVLATQKRNPYQFATTTVTVNVIVESLHTPKFQKPEYEGVITAVGVMAMDLKNKDEPLQILATDDDYAATGGLNPHITYHVNGNSDFSIVGSYLFMTKDLPETTLSLQVVATDTSNDQSATAQLLVEVSSGPTTTSMPLSTTDSMSTSSIGETSTNSRTTEDIVSTAEPNTSTDSSAATTIPSMTTESLTASSMNTGGYGPEDMAALGATLAVLLLICLGLIIVLIVRIQRGKTDWHKIYETSMFRNSLGQGSSEKQGIQYVNDAFQNDEDGDSTDSGGPGEGSTSEEPQKAAEPAYETVNEYSLSPLALQSDNTSQAGSDKSDNDKEVKPILTKEKRTDEGYKSVWFKEDIVPDAKEEVVIIPDNRESDSEEEDEEQPSSSREEDKDDDVQIKSPRVVFNDSDLDSGLGVKMEDPAEESKGDEVLTVDL